MSSTTPGTVYLVGAGPGDPGLLTLKGAECLRRADVVIYDRLAHPDLLHHARPDAERIYVGKQSSRHTLRQEEINALIVEKALEGKTVCRLKGGDPYVFGRGGEEAEACRNVGVPFEEVPGITSSIAAPAYAGIPVTHREAASSFSVITGHEDPSKPESRIRWEHLAHATDTLVFLMGVENLPNIVQQLLAAGRSPETPVALVRWGTWPRQRTLVSMLRDVVSDVDRAGFTAPAVTVVGEVVRLRETLRWFDTKPLFGKRVLVTRAREQASALSDALREAGAEPVEFPVIRIAQPASYEELDSALAQLRGAGVWGLGAGPARPTRQTPDAKPYSWIVFTSANAVRAAGERLKAMGLDSRAFGRAKVAAIGPATADALEDMGIRADFVPTQFVAEAVIEQWPDREMTGKRVLLPRAKEAREILPEKLREKGAEVDVVTVYETVMDAAAADSVRKELLAGEIQVVTFTSSSTVRNFVESIGSEHIRSALEKVTVASIGPITSQTARELGIVPAIEATDHTIPGLVRTLVEQLPHA